MLSFPSVSTCFFRPIFLYFIKYNVQERRKKENCKGKEGGVVGEGMGASGKRENKENMTAYAFFPPRFGASFLYLPNEKKVQNKKNSVCRNFMVSAVSACLGKKNGRKTQKMGSDGTILEYNPTESSD